MRHLRNLCVAALIVAGLSWGISAAGQATQPGATPPAAATPTPRGRARGPAAPYDAHTAMEDMDRVYRAVKADAADPTKIEQTLRNIALLERDCAIAKNTVPNAVTKKTGEERAKAAESYRNMLNSLIKAFIELEDAVVAKKADEVKKLLTEIDELQKVGHADFEVAG